MSAECKLGLLFHPVDMPPLGSEYLVEPLQAPVVDCLMYIFNSPDDPRLPVHAAVCDMDT